MSWKPAATAALILLGVVGLAVLGWFVTSYPIWPYQAACRIYDDSYGLSSDYGELKELSGDYTEEFRRGIIDYYRPFFNKRSDLIKLGGGTVLLTTHLHFDLLESDGKYDGDKEAFRFRASSHVANVIWQKRLSLDGEAMNLGDRFSFENRLTGQQRSMHPDECGMMEELILTGGILNSESKSSNESR